MFFLCESALQSIRVPQNFFTIILGFSEITISVKSSMGHFKTEILLECAKCAIANWHTNVGRLVTSRAMLKNWQTLTRCFNEKLCKQQIFLNFLFQQFFGYKIWATWAENIYFFIQKFADVRWTSIRRHLKKNIICWRVYF